MPRGDLMIAQSSLLILCRIQACDLLSNSLFLRRLWDDSFWKYLKNARVSFAPVTYSQRDESPYIVIPNASRVLSSEGYG